MRTKEKARVDFRPKVAGGPERVPKGAKEAGDSRADLRSRALPGRRQKGFGGAIANSLAN
jgi:hypothetical protein